MSNLTIPMVHLVQDVGGYIFNVGTICCVSYVDRGDSIEFEVTHMGGKFTFADSTLQGGLQKLGISLSGLKIL